MAEMPEDIYQPETKTASASGSPLKSILMLTADGTEDLEFFYPYYRFVEAGMRVDVITPNGGAFKGKQGLGLKQTKSIKDVKIDDYDLLYIPGGKAPAALKKDEAAVALVKQFAATGHPIAAVCHGPQMLAAAGIIKGRKIAAYPEVEKEVVDAGATFVNQATVIDGPFITARWPGDLPQHVKAALAALSKGDASRIPQSSAA